MLSNVQRNIIIKAARIRMERGEKVEEILESYPRLMDADKAEIRAEIQNF